MLDQGEMRENPLPDAATGYRIADDRTAPSGNGREGETAQ
jgi:hypothetical protein